MEKTNNNQSASSPKWKRTTDIVLILFTLPVWLPVAVFVAVLIGWFPRGRFCSGRSVSVIGTAVHVL